MATVNANLQARKMNNETFGSRLAGWRRTQRRTQESVAQSIGISRRSLSKMENDAGKPSWGVAVRIRSELGLSLDYLAVGIPVSELAYRVERRLQP